MSSLSNSTINRTPSSTVYTSNIQPANDYNRYQGVLGFDHYKTIEPTPRSVTYSSTTPSLRSISPTPGITTTSNFNQPVVTRTLSGNPVYTSSVVGPSASPTLVATTTSTGGIPVYQRQDLEVFDTFMSSQDDFTPEIKSIIGMYMDNALDITDILVYGHESLNRPDNLLNLAKDRPALVRLHNELRNEAAQHRQRLARIIEEVKPKIPVRNDANGVILRNAINAINNPSDRPEKTGLQLYGAKDDICIILDRDITGQNTRKFDERNLARIKKDSMYPASRSLTVIPNHATVKIKLNPEDKFVGHEVTKNTPTDDVKVIIDKQPGQFIRTISPPPQIVRTVSPMPQPEPKKKAPVKSQVTTTSGTLENFSSPTKAPVETVKIENEPQRSFAPARSNQ